MSEQDYANVARRIELLVQQGISVSVNRDDRGFIMHCSTYKVKGGMGATLAEALGEFELSLTEAGWLRG